MVLLVVDTQKLIVNEKLFAFDMFVANIKKLISAARNNYVEVIFIRHDDGFGEQLTKGNGGFEISEEFEPLKNEKIFDKFVNSPFKESGLLDYLKSKGENTLIVVGLQTDYCVDATVKCGFEHGFDIIVPEYSNSTFDNVFMTGCQTYEYYNNFMWNGRYAKCISVDEVINLMKS